MTNRVFTDKELEKMGTRTLDLLTQAIESGDKEKAKNLANQMYQESSQMHDMYVDWVALLMDYIYKNHGENALYQALKEWAMQRPTVDVRKLDFRVRVEGLAAWLRGHLVPLKVEEDNEKVCITMEPCGSGQRLVQNGRYGSPCNLTMIQKPHSITWGMTDFPIYCTHEPIIEIVSIEQLGYPAQVVFHPEKVARDKSCTFCIYKNVEDTPEEFYTRVGKQKPRKK